MIVTVNMTYTNMPTEIDTRIVNRRRIEPMLYPHQRAVLDPITDHDEWVVALIKLVGPTEAGCFIF